MVLAERRAWTTRCRPGDQHGHLRARAAFEEVRDELAHISRVTMLGELSASIAHEMNQPLANITINAEATQQYLAEDPPKVNEARALVDSIVASVDRASNVIDRIRALSKKATPETARLDINEVIDETVPLVRSQAIGHRVLMRLELGPKLPDVLADSIQLQQVIINLIINAIDAMKAVTDRLRELVIRSQLYEGGVLVAVLDTGIGIEPEKAGRLFDAFFTTKPDGMGMGSRSAARSSRHMAVGSGHPPMLGRARPYSSHCSEPIPRTEAHNRTANRCGSRTARCFFHGHLCAGAWVSCTTRVFLMLRRGRSNG